MAPVPELDVPTPDDQWHVLSKLERDWRRSNWTKAGLIAVVIIQMVIIAWLASSHLSLTQNNDCRSHQFAQWADDVLLVLDNKKPLNEVQRLEDGYNECGR
jgi:hypothetical protein